MAYRLTTTQNEGTLEVRININNFGKEIVTYRTVKSTPVDESKIQRIEDFIPDPEFVKKHKESEEKIGKEFDYYIKHKKEWQKKYDNTFIAIKGFKVVKHGDDQDDVLQAMIDDGHELGTFLVHRIADDSDVPIRINRFRG